MSFVSTSQAGQDRFVLGVLGHKTNGYFLDVGAWPFALNSNTLSLEKIGWRGLMVDTQDGHDLRLRKSRFIRNDSTTIKWLDVFRHLKLPLQMDFLSLDVDEFTTATLVGLPLHQIRFNVLTVGHDSYWLGPGPRDKNREVLKANGYDLVCEDVMIDYPEGEINSFEDWYVSPRFSKAANKFRCKRKFWSEIVK